MRILGDMESALRLAPVLAFGVACGMARAHADDVRRDISQYGHTAWRNVVTSQAIDPEA